MYTYYIYICIYVHHSKTCASVCVEMYIYIYITRQVTHVTSRVARRNEVTSLVISQVTSLLA